MKRKSGCFSIKVERPPQRISPGLAALFEVGLLFLPAIPAYLWVWPNLEGTWLDLFQGLVYIYIIAGSLFIGLRRWTWDQMGFNWRGIGLSLVCGFFLIGGRSLVILAVDWDLARPGFSAGELLGWFLYYLLLVGFGEELLFRGLIYRAVLDWRSGTGHALSWAIWGSSLAFGLWHVFGQGPLVGITMVFYGLVFALMRWRAGGILGLALVHGLIDFSALLMLPQIDVLGLGQPAIAHPLWMALGLGMLVGLPVYLWKFFRERLRV